MKPAVCTVSFLYAIKANYLIWLLITPANEHEAFLVILSEDRLNPENLPPCADMDTGTSCCCCGGILLNAAGLFSHMSFPDIFMAVWILACLKF